MDANYKISRSSLHVEVTDRLREMIYERSLPPDKRINELGLSARLGTSRTPLREVSPNKAVIFLRVNNIQL